MDAVNIVMQNSNDRDGENDDAQIYLTTPFNEGNGVSQTMDDLVVPEELKNVTNEHDDIGDPQVLDLRL